MALRRCAGLDGGPRPLTQFVPVGDPIKISRLKIVNRSGRARRLSITTYAEWVLGQNRGATAPFITTEINPATGQAWGLNFPVITIADMVRSQALLRLSFSRSAPGFHVATLPDGSRTKMA